MRRASLVVLVLGGVIMGGAPAPAADSGPVIVVPGRLGVPVIINGVDVTGAVIEGDFGLYRPHMVDPRIIAAPAWIARRTYPAGYVQGSYYPAFGHQPGYGRHEIEPPADRRLPPPAKSFHRSWSSQSEPLPADVEPPVPPPPLIVSPQIYPGLRRDGDARPPRR
jgi:hypothetical protein